MKKFIYTVILAAPLIFGGGCKKFLDVNTDPNNPGDVAEALILAPVETSIATNIAGGSYSATNNNGIAMVTNYFMQVLAINQPQPQADGYKLRQDEVDPLWLTNYSTIMQNLNIMNTKAEEKGHHAYGMIAKVLNAYTLGVTTDMWGDVPFKDAFNGVFKPAYQSQEDIYKTLQSLLDSAILEKALDPGAVVPASDDYIYGGDMDKWEKFAYTLKARYYLHLTNAPGYDAATQAALALGVIDKAFASPADEANFAVYSANANAENPWFKNTGEDQGGVVMSSTFIDSLVARNDPRLPIYVTKPNGVFFGKINTSDPDPDFTIFSTVNTFYAGIDAPLSIVNYSEVLFIKAEATLYTSGAAAAEPIFVDAIKSSMTRVGLDLSSPAVTNYLASRGTLAVPNPLERLIEEKVVANFLSIENYNDWRRTNFPKLAVVQVPFVPTIPVRFPYPLAEVTANPQPQHTLTITDPVWWDGN